MKAAALRWSVIQCNGSFKLLGAGAGVASVGAKVHRVKLFAVSRRSRSPHERLWQGAR